MSTSIPADSGWMPDGEDIEVSGAQSGNSRAGERFSAPVALREALRRTRRPAVTAPADAIVRRSVLNLGAMYVEYYTSQPAPTQWIAVGLLKGRADGPAHSLPTSLVVGSGRTEQLAVTALRERLMQRELPSRIVDRDAEINYVPVW